MPLRKNNIQIFFVLAHVLAFHLLPASVSAKIESYAALGDSYAAGAGAGSHKSYPILDGLCARFSDAYPVQVANSSSLDIQEHQFRNLACGGSSTSRVLEDQVPCISDSQIVTLTVGGVEVDFLATLNECVHQWRPFSTCEKALEKSRGLMQSSKFIESYDKLLKGAVQNLDPGARILQRTHRAVQSRVFQHDQPKKHADKRAPYEAQ